MNKLIEVDSKNLNVRITGAGEQTLILLSGSGVPIPVLEYRSMVDALALQHKVIVIEKFGYGWSELTEKNREVDTVVEEYRSALQRLDVKAPVILMAHSMGMIEALRWSQLYPNEVCGLIGLDPATPECYRDFNIEAALEGLLHLAENEQLRKETATAVLAQLVDEFGFSGEDLEQYEALVNRNLANHAWISEAENLRGSVALVESGNTVQVPTLFLISNGGGTTIDTEVWRNHAKDYLNKIEVNEYKLFDYPHNLNKYVPDEIAQSVRDFVLKNFS